MTLIPNTAPVPIALRPLLHTADNDRHYVPRPGAYAVILSKRGELLTIETGTGVFLPGGGQDPGETLLDTLVREIDEELGVAIAPIQYLLAADDCRYSPIYKEHFHIQSHYFLGSIGDQSDFTPEKDAKAVWYPLEVAAKVLTRGNDRWLMELFLGDFQIDRPAQHAKPKQPMANSEGSERKETEHQVHFTLSQNSTPVARVALSLGLERYRVLDVTELSAVPSETVAEKLVYHLQHTFGDIPMVDASGRLKFG